MKKINKYIRDAGTPSLREELKRYKTTAQAFRQQPTAKTAKKMSPLAAIIPFAAASLTPFAISAQCNPIIQLGPGQGNPGTHFIIDIDGDGGTDFHIDADQAAPADLYVKVHNASAEVVATPGYFNAGMGIQYYSASRFATNNPIAESAAWKGFATMPIVNTFPQATMAFNNTAGAWQAGGGTQTGFLGVRINGTQLGFIQVSWTDATGTLSVNAALSGTQTPGNATGMGSSVIEAGICASLPVELTRFEGKMRSSHAELAWTTASEADNKGFEIQRSKDGKNFETVGFVAGQGNSTIDVDYSFNDEGIRKGVDYYYRLQQFDFWGRSTASEVINLNALETDTRLNISPNPVAGEFITVDYQSEGNSSAELTVFDARGQQLINQNLDADSKSNFQLNIKELPSGSYFLKVEDAGIVEYRQFIKS